ncbi:MAG: dTMP kinase [Armatimonadota bacterium]|nr:dTMP kinase [Armatimonadota bacterium]
MMAPPAPNNGGAREEGAASSAPTGVSFLVPPLLGAGGASQGLFLTFEGVEGAGKTTQIARLAARLRDAGRQDVLTTREPGDGPLGQELRQLALHPPMGLHVEPRAELLIMLADRAQHVGQVIRPHLESGGIVLCDRYADSSVAYQGYGRGLDIGEIVYLNTYATGGLQPELTILLDLDPTVGLARQSERNVMEDQALPFHQRIRAGFQALAKAESERWLVLDASRLPEIVHQDIWDAVSSRLHDL